jgi:hypothetical protein
MLEVITGVVLIAAIFLYVADKPEKKEEDEN